MNLKTSLTEYIESVGDQAAAELFGKKVSTIKTWTRSGAYPMDAIQKFLDICETYPTGEVQLTNDTAQINEKPAIVPNGEPGVHTLMDMLNELNVRVTHIENWLRQNPPASNPVPQMAGAKPTAQWYKEDPTTVGFGSNVRPGATVPDVRTFGIPAPPVAGVGRAKMPVARVGAPASVWLTPKKK